MFVSSPLCLKRRLASLKAVRLGLSVGGCIIAAPMADLTIAAWPVLVHRGTITGRSVCLVASELSVLTTRHSPSMIHLISLLVIMAPD